MNILFLCYQGDIAGATHSIYYLAKGLAERGHNVYMGCRRESLLYGMLQPTQVKLLPMTFKSKLDWNNIRQIKDAVKRYNIQVINAQSSKDRYTSIFANLIFGLGVPIVHTRRQIPKSTGFCLQNWFYGKFTCKIVAVSEGVKEALVDLGLKRDHIQVIHNGTPGEKYHLKDSNKIKELRERYGIKPGDRVIGCVSRNKQQEQLLEAIYKLDMDFKVILVGVEARDEYRRITKRHSRVRDIYYTGLVDSSEVLYYYKLFTIKVLPSNMEGLSQSLLEAMALGVPVVATRAGGNPDMITDGENGFLFAEHNINELAAKMTQLLNDEILQEKFRAAGKKTALKKFSIENTINAYERFFRNLTEEDSLDAVAMKPAKALPD